MHKLIKKYSPQAFCVENCSRKEFPLLLPVENYILPKNKQWGYTSFKVWPSKALAIAYLTHRTIFNPITLSIFPGHAVDVYVKKIDNINAKTKIYWNSDFPGGSDCKESTCMQETWNCLIPGSGRSPGGGHGNPLQYSCLENPRGQRSLAAAVSRITESDTT